MSDLYQGQKISPQTFPCFVCKDKGYPNVQVYLAGKDQNGKPIRLEEDRKTLHRHRGQNKNQGQGLFATGEAQQIIDVLQIMDKKLDGILKYVGGDPLNDDGDASRESPEHDPNY